MSERNIAIAGGGAAGFFAAIACAELAPKARITIFEATGHFLAKVSVSGGGRCNVTHACFEPRDLIKRYPRGHRELLGAFHRWQPRDTVAWFSQRGVELKAEPDGRMFPITDNSQTIVDCLKAAAERLGVQLRLRCGLVSAARIQAGGFELNATTGEAVHADVLLLATGGNRSSAGYEIAAKLGHTVVPPVPSLFTFNVADPRIQDLAGISVADAVASVPELRLSERGPVLVTHWGLSGPGILRLSAWGARELHSREYRFPLRLNWAGGRSREEVRSELAAQRVAHPKKHVSGSPILAVPQRLWERLVTAAGVKADVIWTSMPNSAVNALADQITAGEYAVTGKSMNKDEFVTCGGVRLSEVDFKTMQSRICPGLFFAGELLDIDGVTGGFNFQAAWTTGRLAGQGMAGFSL